MSPVKRTLHGRELAKCAKPGCTRTVHTEGPDVCSKDVAYRLGVPWWILNKWAEAGHLKPESAGSGSPRVWPAAELEVARQMGRLTNAGLPVEFAARFARSGEKRAELAPGIYVEVTW